MLSFGGQRYDEMQQRREELRREINAIYQRYDEHIGSRLRGGLGFDDNMPTDEEYAAYDLPNTPLKALETELFKLTIAMQDLRLKAA